MINTPFWLPMLEIWGPSAFIGLVVCAIFSPRIIRRIIEDWDEFFKFLKERKEKKKL